MTDPNPAVIMAAHADHTSGPSGEMCKVRSASSQPRCLPYRLAAELAALREQVQEVADDWSVCLDSTDPLMAHFQASEWAACLRANLPKLRAVLAGEGASCSCGDPDCLSSDHAAGEGAADQPQPEWVPVPCPHCGVDGHAFKRSTR